MKVSKEDAVAANRIEQVLRELGVRKKVLASKSGWEDVSICVKGGVRVVGGPKNMKVEKGRGFLLRGG